MFFQPKFFRGSKATPPPARDHSRDRAGSLPLADHHSSDVPRGSASTGCQAAQAYDTASKRPKSRRRWNGDDYSLNAAQESASVKRTDYLPPAQNPSTPTRHHVDFSCPSPLPPLPPVSPLSHAYIPPSLKRVPYTPANDHTYAINHSTTPSLSSDTSKSSASNRSFASDALLTPVRSYLHPPASPALSLSPSRPLPPLPAAQSLPRLRLRRPSILAPKSIRSPQKAAAPPLGMCIYASMPLPPLPCAESDPGISAPASERSNSSRTLLLPEHSLGRERNRDSQVTVRPSDQTYLRYRDPTSRDTRPVHPRPSVLYEADKDSHILIRTESGLFEFDEGEFEVPDFNLLSVFPMPPARSFDPSKTPSIRSRRPSGCSTQAGVTRDDDSIMRNKRLSSRSTIRPLYRKAAPPPLPLLNFDLFSIDDDGRGVGVRDRVSEADRIREQYLRGRRRT